MINIKFLIIISYLNFADGSVFKAKYIKSLFYATNVAVFVSISLCRLFNEIKERAAYFNVKKFEFRKNSLMIFYAIQFSVPLSEHFSKSYYSGRKLDKNYILLIKCIKNTVIIKFKNNNRFFLNL